MVSPRNREAEVSSSQGFTPSRLQRLRRLWRDYQWPVMLTLLALSLLLGYIGFSKYARAIGEAMSALDILYVTLQLAMLDSGALTGPLNWELEVARWLVPLVAAWAAVLAAATLFRTQLQMVRLWFLRNHVIICGLGEKGTLLARSFRARGYEVVAIEQDQGNSQIGLCREQRAIVLVGDATEAPLLRRAAVHRARYVISVCGDDGANVEVAVSTRQSSAQRKQGAVTCSIHLLNPQLCKLLRERTLGAEAFTPFRLELFNVFERGARIMLRVHPAVKAEAKAGSHGPHLLVVGLGRMGENLVLHAARDWYAEERGTGRILQVSVVDREAKGKVRSLGQRYPQLNACCELTGYEIDVADAEFQTGKFLVNEGGLCDPDIVYVCLQDSALGLQAGLTLRHQLGQDEPRIVVRMEEGGGLAKLLQEGEGTGAPYRNVYAFSLLERTCTPTLVLDGTHEVLAQAVHEAYRQERRRQAKERERKQEDEQVEADREEDQLEQDEAMLSWELLPEYLKESNRQQVDHIRTVLRAAGYAIKPLADWEAMFHEFDPEEIQLMARLEHERFVEERTHDGWIRGAKKDPEKKTHPDLCPWEDLPEPAIQKALHAVTELPKVLARGEFQVYCMDHDQPTGQGATDLGSAHPAKEESVG